MAALTRRLLALLIVVPGVVWGAYAATTATLVTLSTTAYTDLGAGPMYLGAPLGTIVFQIADSKPADGALGLPLHLEDRPLYLPGTAHVWAKALNSGAKALVFAGSGISS